jgi:hypothetical protein
MNTKLLSISLALPILMIGAGSSLAKKVIVANQDTPKLTESTTRISQVRLKTQQPQPFLISARDEEKKECQWLGICKEK